ncbi:hypothetical protein AVEN_19452-1 [Araneus ventricosus]|uniref:Uncharacterized protein n=1 Tax=Araneus ventricosus TaxID=182803 RepID=A0A4Y2C8J3_ARAVE|nr:hypothetical protein AVEN_19452-1 [Araneus ventricosus]
MGKDQPISIHQLSFVNRQWKGIFGSPFNTPWFAHLTLKVCWMVAGNDDHESFCVNQTNRGFGSPRTKNPGETCEPAARELFGFVWFNGARAIPG